MSDKTEPGITFSIPEILDTIKRKYDDWYELRFNCFENIYIENAPGGIEKNFKSLTELHTWVAKTRIELDKAEAKQNAINDKINARSANVDIMNQRW